MADTKIYSVIIGAGMCIPEERIPNSRFLYNEFFNRGGIRISSPFHDKDMNTVSYRPLGKKHSFYDKYGHELTISGSMVYDRNGRIASPFRDKHGNEIAFDGRDFYGKGKEKLMPTDFYVYKVEEISGIRSRRHIQDNLMASDIAVSAAKKAVESAGINPDTLDEIIITHFCGDIKPGGLDTGQFFPNFVSKIRDGLHTKKPKILDYQCGCTGFLDCLVYANESIKSGNSKKIMVVAVDTLDRVLDDSDYDSMLFGPGSGGVVLGSMESNKPIGFLTDAYYEDLNLEHLICMGQSNNPAFREQGPFIKMNMGPDVHRWVLKNTPKVIVASLNMIKLSFNDIDKFIMHQANMRMNVELFEELYEKCNPREDSEPEEKYKDRMKRTMDEKMPMTIQEYANMSVATIPPIISLLLNRDDILLQELCLSHHELKDGDNVLFIAAGAGMKTRSIVYRVGK